MDFDSTTKTGPAKELTVTPTFSGCTAFGFAATITTNGCTYQLGQPEGFEDEWEGGFTIKCPAGKAIVIKVDNVFAKCTVEIGEQTPTGAVTYENETFAAGFNLAFSFTNIKDKVATSSGLCVLTAGEHTNSVYKGSSTAEALEGGLLAIGEFETEDPESGKFLHSKYPNKVHAIQTTKHVLTTTGSEVKCGAVNFDGTTKTGPASELILTPTFSDCVAYGFAATITANGCTYRLAQPKGFEDEWEGGFAIKCPEGKKIVITVNNVFAQCTVEIGEQTPTGTVAYENETFGTGFNLAFSFSNVKDNVVISSGLCPLTKGEHATSTYTGASTAESLEGGLLAIG